jgi:uncharacterized membrane protein YoaK (UPF0700 family)
MLESVRPRRLFSRGALSERIALLAIRVVTPSFVVGAICWLAGAVQVGWGIMAVASAIGCGLLVVALVVDRDHPPR